MQPEANTNGVAMSTAQMTVPVRLLEESTGEPKPMPTTARMRKATDARKTRRKRLPTVCGRQQTYDKMK
jgi:hypothetical protein